MYNLVMESIELYAEFSAYYFNDNEPNHCQLKKTVKNVTT